MARASDRTTTKFNDPSFLADVNLFLNHQWFAEDLDQPADVRFALLLIQIKTSAEFGHALSKKQAWTRAGVSDVKTARKYLARAIELGLIEVRRSERDKRVEHLYPTLRLENLLAKEFSLIATIAQNIDLNERVPSKIADSLRALDQGNAGAGVTYGSSVTGGAGEDGMFVTYYDSKGRFHRTKGDPPKDE